DGHGGGLSGVPGLREFWSVQKLLVGDGRVAGVSGGGDRRVVGLRDRRTVMGWLKKVGQVALQIVVGIDTFGPIVKSVAPDKVDRAIDRIGDYTRQSADIIAYAEIMGQALGNVSGPDKLKAATPAMAQVILRSDAMIGKK